VVLSVKIPLRDPPRPLSGTLPCGDRTFLPLARAAIHPVSVPLRVIAIRLGRALLRGSSVSAHCAETFSNLPGSLTERAAPSPLFGLAPRGVCPASRITPSAVRSYRTFSPLPRSPKTAWRYVFCGTFRKDPFERSPPAVSRHVALWRPDFPPACASGYPSAWLCCGVEGQGGCYGCVCYARSAHTFTSITLLTNMTTTFNNSSKHDTRSLGL
jgi:hypothetical protein